MSLDDDNADADAWAQLENENERRELDEWLDSFNESFNDTTNEESMKLPAKSGSDFQTVPAGNHVAICNAIVDLGWQQGRGQYPQPKHEVYVRFELPTEQITYVKDGHEITGPMSIGRRFTASMSEKANLRKFIENWFGKKFPSDQAAADFDLDALLGRKCLLNVTHNEAGGKTYANMANATPIPKGMPAEFTQHNPSIMFDLETSPDSVFQSLPEWLQKVINERLPDPNGEKSDSAEPVATAPEFDDEIPF